jgi:CBS domain-containing protein
MARVRGGRTVAPEPRSREVTVSTTDSTLPRLARVTVEQFMHAGVVVCDPQAPLVAAAAMLSRHRIHCLVVARSAATSAGARLRWGTLTDRDLIRAVAAGDADATAGRAAATEVVTVEPSETLDRVVQLMNEHEVAHLVVADNGAPVGVISSLDVARAVAATS